MLAVHTNGPSRRWVGVGHGSSPDAAVAGTEAALSALAGRDDARLMIVFCAHTYDLSILLAGIRAAAPGVPVIGCSTAGELSASGAGDATVVATALGGPGFSVATKHALVGEDGLRTASFEAASCMNDVPETEHSVLMILSDGL